MKIRIKIVFRKAYPAGAAVFNVQNITVFKAFLDRSLGFSEVHSQQLQIMLDVMLVFILLSKFLNLR